MSLTSLQSLGISHVIAPPNNCRSENMVRKQDSVSSRNQVHIIMIILYTVRCRGTEATTSLAFYSIGQVSRCGKKSSKVSIFIRVLYQMRECLSFISPKVSKCFFNVQGIPMLSSMFVLFRPEQIHYSGFDLYTKYAILSKMDQNKY